MQYQEGMIRACQYVPQILVGPKMSSHNEAHEALSLPLTRDGFPPTCVCNNARDIIKGKFHCKLKDAHCYLKQLEPYTLWLNSA